MKRLRIGPIGKTQPKVSSRPEVLRKRNGGARSGGMLLIPAAAGLMLVVAGCGDQRDQRARDLQWDWGTVRDVPEELRVGRQVAVWPLTLRDPAGIAVTPEGQVAVAGADHFVLLDGRGEETSRFPLPEPAQCVAAGPEGHLWIGFRNRVAVLDRATGQVDVWPAPGEQAVITGLAANERYLYAADAGHRIVYRYSHAGERLGTVAGRDPVHSTVGLVVPSPCLDIAVGPDDSLWVVNPGRRRIENYRPDGSFLSSWLPPADLLAGFSGCCNPTHLAIRSDGSFITSEKGIVRVKLFGPTGDFRGILAGPADFAENEEGLDLAVLPDGRILVLVPGEAAIRVYLDDALEGAGAVSGGSDQ